MGIPGFATRMRGHGTFTTIGSTTAPQRDHAIIDGPSLAHALLQLTPEAMSSDGAAIMPRISYSALGKAAVSWLDHLQRCGFVIEAIYFDGALPAHKKSTRIDRLQAYVDKLAVYRAVHGDVAKVARKARNNFSPDRRKPAKQGAQRGLPPPPFLVFAVVEALRESEYASRTFVVDGEADELCAAKAMAISASEDCSAVSIFTNDSDLIIYGFNGKVRVVQINDTVWEESAGGRSLSSLEFWPSRLRALDGDLALLDLVRPAYLMKQDPHLSFRNALSRTRHDLAAFKTKGVEVFAASYDLTNARSELHKKTNDKPIDRPNLDSRVSEVLSQTGHEKDRVLFMEHWYGNEEARNLSRMKADLEAYRKQHRAARTDTESCDPEGGLASRVATKDFAVDQKAEDLRPRDIDFFLPILFEDTTRATAWKVGTTVREVAMRMAITLSGLPAIAQEYRRAGQRICATARATIEFSECSQHIEDWTGAWREDLGRVPSLENAQKWRLLVMKIFMNDLIREEMILPTRGATLEILAGSNATTWEMVHFSAQFQAVYYSLRVLKQVLDFWVYMRYPIVLDRSITEAVEVLQSLPTVVDLCEPHLEGTSSEWGVAVERLLNEYAPIVPSKATEATDTPPVKESRKARKKRKRLEQTANAFSLLEDMEET